MTKAHRIDRCMGRVEFKASEDEIIDMHKRGYANKHIYVKLTEEGKLSLAYSTFNGYIRKLLQTKTPNQLQNKLVNTVGKEEKENPKVFTVSSERNMIG